MRFDEPPSKLDAGLRRSMREEIRVLQQRLKRTVACLSLDRSEALAPWRSGSGMSVGEAG